MHEKTFTTISNSWSPEIRERLPSASIVKLEPIVNLTVFAVEFENALILLWIYLSSFKHNKNPHPKQTIKISANFFFFKNCVVPQEVLWKVVNWKGNGSIKNLRWTFEKNFVVTDFADSKKNELQREYDE